MKRGQFLTSRSEISFRRGFIVPTGFIIGLLCSGCAEVTNAGAVGAYSFVDSLAPVVSIQALANSAASALSMTGGAIAAVGANVTTLGATSLADHAESSSPSSSSTHTSGVVRLPEDPIETEYTAEIRRLRAEVEQSKSFKKTSSLR